MAMTTRSAIGQFAIRHRLAIAEVHVPIVGAGDGEGLGHG